MTIRTKNTKKWILFFFFLSCCKLGLYAQVDLLKKTELITSDGLKKHIEILASDSIEGRKTGERGQKLAADYIKEQFAQMGLTPIKLVDEQNPWYQSFTIEALKDFSYIKIDVDGIEKPISGIKNFLYFGRLDYNAPISIRYEFYNGDKPIEGNGLCIHAKSLEDGILQISSAAEKSKNFIISVPDKIYKSLFKEYRFLRRERLILHKNNEDYYKVIFIEGKKASSFQIKQLLAPFLASKPDYRVVITSEDIIKEFFVSRDLRKALRKKNTATIISKNLKLTGVNSDLNFDTLYTENVIGKIEGTDKNDEVVVICAHYDHIGRINQDHHGGKYNNEICNGADDNASGTAAVIEVAKLFSEMQKRGIKPKRTILFIAFTGEELGLFGSEYYVQNPITPLNKIKTVINLDMIGRTSKHNTEANDYVFILNKKNKRELNQLGRKNGKLIGLKVDYTPGLRLRLLMNFASDHRPFVSRDVPAIMMTTGEHPDYHTPRDDSDKINFRRAALITRLAFLDAWALANE